MMCYKTLFFDCEKSVSVSTARFAVKLVFPKFNSYIFLIHLWIRYATQLERNKLYKKVNMSGFALKTIPEQLHKKIVRKYFDKTTCDNFYSPHIIIVPRVHFDLLYSENLYYRDGKTLWMSMTLNRSKDIKKELEIKNDFQNIKRFLKYESKSSNSNTELNSMTKSSFFVNNETDESTFTERIVQIVPCNMSSEENVYVTEVEFFNIKNSIVSKHSQRNYCIKFIPIKSENVAPKIAQRISVQMVNTSSNIGTDLVDAVLTNYFKSPQFLHENDYFTVPLQEKYMGPLFLKYSNIVNSIQALYFKCTKMECSPISTYGANEVNLKSSVNTGCFVVRGETDVLQDQNFNSYIPAIVYFELNVKETSSETIDINKHMIENCPYGLDTYFAAMKKSIEPFLLDKQVSPLHTELKCVLRPVFLLRGDLGAGCHLLITRLAQNFGLHFFATSCRSLTASTAKQTEAKLEAVFQKAKTTAPVLIHLQDFNTFGVDAENNEDSRIVESLIQKLKDLYDNFTKFPIVVIASCENSIELKPNILRIFLETFTIKSPNRADRLEMLKWLVLTKNMSFCNENFQPLLSIDESILSMTEEKNTFNVNTVDAESNRQTDSDKNENSPSSVRKEINKPNDFNETRRKKNKDSTGKKTKNKSSKYASNCNDKNERENIEERKSAELAVEMVSLEKRLLHTPITKDITTVKDIQNEIISTCPINDSKNPSKKQSDNSSSQKLDINKKVSSILDKLSSKTDSFVYGDLDMLTNLALKNAYMANHKVNTGNDIAAPFKMGMIREIDFENALESLRLMQSKKLGSLKIPNVEWEDIGGLEDLKKEISRTIELPLKFPHLLANSGLKRSGLLLWGPPGCGKTLVARAVASQLKAAFLSVKGPELLDMYVGQSERNMRDMFAAARACAPCVIFLDEAEAAAGSRGASGDAGGAADRLVSQLLAELDGVAALQTDTQTGPVIVIAATNRPDLVEPALLRPGRLDRLLYVGPYKGETNKIRVLVAACRGYNLAENVKLNDISEKLPQKCTGADLSAIVNTARKYALARAVQRAESGEVEPSKLSEEDIIISVRDFEKAVINFVPSISESEMNYYESLRSKLS